MWRGEGSRKCEGVSRFSLLQHYLIAFLQPAEHFRLRAVGYPNVDCEFVLAVLALRIGNFHGGLLILVVKNRAFRNLEDSLVLFQNDLSIGGHLSLEFAARILN